MLGKLARCPRVTDVPLRDIVDIVLKAAPWPIALRLEIPGTNMNGKLPEGKILIPGVVAHTTNLVERPELVAWRIANCARLVGKENVIAGTDCGFSQGAFTPRVHQSIMRAKLQALAEGAKLATKQLW